MGSQQVSGNQTIMNADRILTLVMFFGLLITICVMGVVEWIGERRRQRRLTRAHCRVCGRPLRLGDTFIKEPSGEATCLDCISK